MHIEIETSDEEAPATSEAKTVSAVGAILKAIKALSKTASAEKEGVSFGETEPKRMVSEEPG